MVVLRCTHKLLVRLKRADVPTGVDSTTRLGDWHGNILRIGRRQHLIFISESQGFRSSFRVGECNGSRACFLTLCDVLAAVGVGADDIGDERWGMSEIAFGRTRDRSVLGTLNDFVSMAAQGSANRAEPESAEALMRFLAQTPILPLDGASPIALTCAAFATRSGG
jgi:hypothetical protein